MSVQGRRIGRLGAVVTAVLGFALLVPQTAATAADPGVQHYLSRTDLTPPVLDVRTPAAADIAPGYLFFAPKRGAVQSGPVIMDNSGQLIWSGAAQYPGANDFRVQTYRGQQVLTFWVGTTNVGYGYGHYVMLDSHYNQIGTVYAGAGLQGDLHEFRLTPQGTALITAYVPRQVDLRPVGGSQQGWIMDSVFQEIDVATGKVLYTWRSYDHAPVTESFVKLGGNGTQSNPYDYFHINSVDKAANGDWLVSARNTHMLYRVNHTTKKLVYRIGGKRSYFKMGPGSTFDWQHDAQFVNDTTISLFDNEDDDPNVLPNRGPSRAEILTLNTANMTADDTAYYHSPQNLLSTTQGDVQLVNGPGSNPDRHVFVGWGAQPWISEFSSNGRLLFDATFGAGDSYRAYRAVWHATPSDRPAQATNLDGATMHVSMSWNGATDVARWRVLTGTSPDDLTKAATVNRSGFETTADVPVDNYVQVEALDADGNVISSGNVAGTGAQMQ